VEAFRLEHESEKDIQIGESILPIEMLCNRKKNARAGAFIGAIETA
jgi:hypothetical protein